MGRIDLFDSYLFVYLYIRFLSLILILGPPPPRTGGSFFSGNEELRSPRASEAIDESQDSRFKDLEEMEG